MNFNFKSSNASAKPAAQAAKKRITVEDAYEMEEIARLAARRAKKMLATAKEYHEVTDNLTVVSILKQTNSLETLSASDLNDLSEAVGTSVEGLKTMSVEDFCSRVEALVPGYSIKAEPATESIVAGVVLITLFAASLVASAIAARKMTKVEVWYLTREADEIFREKGKEALTAVMADIFDAKEFTKQLDACDKIIDFMSKDAKTIFSDDTSIADIEKQALQLWSAPTGIAGSESNKFTAIYRIVDEWFTGWTDNAPERSMKTLKDHGFTHDSLVSITKRIIDFCDSYDRVTRSMIKFNEGHAEAIKKIEPGFWKSIKLFFTESKEDREERKQAELILNAKILALRYLASGLDDSICEMCNQIMQVALKTEKYVKAAKPAKTDDK